MPRKSKATATAVAPALATTDLVALATLLAEAIKASSDSKKVSDNAELVDALKQAINLTKPIEKKTFATRKPKSPWDPQDGTPKLKLKRKMYQHGIPIDPDVNDNATIDALNHLKVGRYLGDWVKVYKRKDQGIDIDYPVKTASQRMKLPGMGITEQRDPSTGKLIKSGLQIFVERMIEEGKRPKKELPDEDSE